MPAPKGNQFAAKPSAEKRTAKLFVPVTPAEKAQVVRDAGGRKLADYVRERLGISEQ